MENDDKYYIPEIEDLRVGYEMETNIKYFVGKEIWEPTVLKGVDTAVREYHKIGMYRTPYLTKEQIEAEGWNDITKSYQKPQLFIGEKMDGEDYYKLIYSFYRESHIFSTNACQMQIELLEGSCIFNGECKSINELRYICKLLKI